MRPLVLFRSDASISLGTGHIVRCLTLATALKKQGVCVHFICVNTPGNLFTLIEKHNITLYKLPLNNSKNGLVDGHTDAELTIQYIKTLPKSPDLIIVDHYELDYQWEEKVRLFSKRLCVIDDLFNRKHTCDILLNQSVLSILPTEKNSSLPNCTYLIGPKYSLLQEEYSLIREKLFREFQNCKKILIFFGGVDKENLTLKVLQAICRRETMDLQFDVIIGVSNQNKDLLISFSNQWENIKIHCGLPNLAEKFAQTDLAIGAGGTTTWERLCLGTPSIVISIAENQRRSCEELANKGYIFYLGTEEEFEPTLLLSYINLLKNHFLRKFLSKHSSNLVDGKGCKRVCEYLLLPNNLTIRTATPDDSEMIFSWRNAESIRKFSSSSEKIHYTSHQIWFEKSLKNQDRIILIGSLNKTPFGVVRYDINSVENFAEISIFLAPDFLGKGLGPFLLQKADNWLQTKRKKLTEIHAIVLAENKASHNMFIREGYTHTQVKYIRHLIRQKSREKHDTKQQKEEGVAIRNNWTRWGIFS